MTIGTGLRAAIVVALGVTAGGCGGPLLVWGGQSRGDEVHFGFEQQGTGRQGIIECQVAGSGDLHSCREMDIEFVE